MVVEDSFEVLMPFYVATWHYILQVPNLCMQEVYVVIFETVNANVL